MTRVAIVTERPAASGAATAQRLAADGLAVAVLDLEESAAKGTAEAIESAGGRALAVGADVGDAEQVAAAVERVAAGLGAPTVLINNAGVTRDNLLFKMTETDWDTVMGVHLRGSFLMARAVQKHMVDAKWGRIVNLSSTSALGNRGQANYSTAKAGLQGFTKTLAIELGKFGVTANCIAPGFIVSEMTKATAARIGEDWDSYVAARAAQIPVARAGQVEDIAHAVSFFVSEAAGFVSGQVLYVAGGPEGLMRFIFRPPASHAAGLLSLPWHEPLEEWSDDRLLEVAHRGISRHVVRFVEVDGMVFALKEIGERLARREYKLLGELEAMGMPAVSVLGICVERADGQDAILVTRFLDYSMSYRYVFSHRSSPVDRLVDGMVELLARLHLAGLYWGDCSLSNTLFRPDAGTFAAWFVDAETAEMHPTLTVGQRHSDIDNAAERVGGELFDLQDGGLLPPDVDPIAVAHELPARYHALWEELTREETFRPDEQRYRVAERVERLNDLGFDVDELELVTTAEGTRLRVQTRVAEAGRDRRRLFALTGLEATENQARRLLNDVVSYRGYLEQKEGRIVPETVAGHRWRTDVYDKVMAMVPEALADRLAPAEIFHEILEHRWFLSEHSGTDVGTTAAAQAYVEAILPSTPSTLTVLPESAVD